MGLSGRPVRALPRPPLWIAYAALIALVGCVLLSELAVPKRLTSVVTASAALAVFAGIRLHRPDRRTAWRLIGLGLAVSSVPGLGGLPRFAPLYVLGQLLIMAALVVFLRDRRGWPDRATTIDATIIAVAYASLTWLYLLGPYASAAKVNGIAAIWSVVISAIDVGLVALAAAVLLGLARGCGSARLLTLSLGSLVGSHMVFLWFSMHAGQRSADLNSLAWTLFVGALGAAALHPSMGVLSEPATRTGQALTPARLVIFAIASILAPTVAIVRTVLDQPRHVAITVASGVISLLVLLRVAELARVHGRLLEDALRTRFESRVGALVRNSSEAVCIVNAEGALQYTSPAALALIGVSAAGSWGQEWAVYVHPDDRPALRRFLADLEPGSSGGIDYRVRRRDGAWRHVETLATNLLGDGAVEGIVLNTRDVTDRKALERRLVHQATHDTLTGLPNRTLLRDRVEQALARRRRTRAPLAVIFLDLDDFKNVNDTLGHAAGDAVLQEVARRLDTCLRASDTATRLGGDEFAVLVDDLADESEAVAVAERILTELARPMQVGDRTIEPEGTVGIAFAADGRETSDTLLRDADAAMYLAKDRGKGAYAIFEPAMHAAAVARLELRSDLARAIEHGEITLHYQPVVDLRTGWIPAYESLARWTHPERGPVPPCEFIPLAEETGLIIPLGRDLLRRVCKQIAVFRETCTEGEPIRASVNVSARQFVSDELVDDVRAAIEAAGIRPQDLILELTESAMMSDIGLAASRLEELRALGVGLAVDDFGTGYSSLNSIRTFPVDRLKIDRSFIAHLDDTRTRALTGTIIELGAVLDMLVVAEGIEDAAQAAAVLELGCPFGQGYFLQRPIPVDEVLEHLAEHGRWIDLPALAAGRLAA
jgi:diguanylate cyclase (GGDEF)-like protein/PAS domain S-box-containing protein